jgi:hypothetical protein
VQQEAEEHCPQDSRHGEIFYAGPEWHLTS